MCKTGNLRLVRHGIRFLESAHKYSSDLENTKYMLHLPHETIEETKAFLLSIDEEWKKESPDFYEFAILLEGKHIGAVSIYLYQDRSIGELGWILDRDYHGCGYAFEAAKQAIRYGREKLNIKRFVAHCDSENTASYKLMEKLGMKLECVNENRKNRSSPEIRRELQYELELD